MAPCTGEWRGRKERRSEKSGLTVAGKGGVSWGTGDDRELGELLNRSVIYVQGQT